MALTSLGRLSFYHVSFFPRAMGQIFREAVMFGGGDPSLVTAWQRQYLHFLRKVQLVQPGRPLLLKNPANTARITLLREMFPGARFVHIHRDPLRVFASTVHLYLKTQTAWGLQAVDRGRIVDHVLETYPMLMDAYFAQSRDLGEGELVEVRFRDLQRDALGTLRHIYDRIGIGGFEQAEPYFASYLQAQQGYRKNVIPLAEDERKAVEAHWGAIIARLGYYDSDSI
ncbi:MAG: sulfotransferase [Paracoccaceae bacterium]|nr:sulfotransferase [Paracoccaceae bacterium]